MVAPFTDGFAFHVLATDGHARRSILITPHGPIHLPTFMPVGTQGSIKTLTPEEVFATGAQIILGNTYHLSLRPGPQLIQQLGGLHHFMQWPSAILTDSGGFQVFSLGEQRSSRLRNTCKSAQPLVKITEEGVTFRSHLDGSLHHLSPEEAVRIQGALGSDIQMPLDLCPSGNAPRPVVEQAVLQTTAWAKRAIATPRSPRQALFGIVQGGCFADLRQQHAEELAALDPGFDGLALGGFSVGETMEQMVETLAQIAPILDAERPRYLMGVGTPLDLLEAIEHGMDMFDCVLPTRNARNGQVFTHSGKLSIKQKRFKQDPSPLDPRCACPACRSGFSRAYLRHLYLSREILVLRLLSLHNLHFYAQLMAEARQAISLKRYLPFKQEWKNRLEHDAQ
ncbi:tRNA guanosine(34) transglycosylase Tgt [Pajaroellobacter abortibovis]|uniref:Queuine tRNA-ribosyltransferase n=1 Tax=Pajaroellobacter abortibovis TaxID=1882918 RepID=A0A1L6MW90_9BACT|nr:tRNA guanosine(34) transglycosylase Tgt [Pajaroellobacter abortibovis]APR99810.1 tRNA guanosine(34) transglycosylase Tgt [Pajaroellobacter abortibovis]